MKVAFQGEHGAYGEEAIMKQFGKAAEPVPRPQLKDVFEAVECQQAELGIVPVENTLEGSIYQTFDLLLESPLKVRGEVILRVIHSLIVNPGVQLSDVKTVYSHPQALGQCRAFIDRHRLEAVAAYNTAGSVKMLKEKGLTDAAAIASSRAAEVYDMDVLARGIETHPENYTRFLILGASDHPPTGHDKTSLAFSVDHVPGSLFRALKGFADRGINLTKIESRPLIGRPLEYTFHLDFEGHKEDARMRSALEELKLCSLFVKVFGSYPKADLRAGA